MMTLYSGTTCPFSQRCRIVLYEKGMDFQIIDVDIHNKPEELAVMNPYNQVPVLVERDLILHESNIINEYIDERFPHPQLMPADPVMRARARLFLYRFEQELFSHVDAIEHGSQKAADKARAAVRDSLAQLAPMFAKQKYMLGEEFSMLDVAIAPMLWRLDHYGIVHAETGRALAEIWRASVQSAGLHRGADSVRKSHAQVSELSTKPYLIRAIYEWCTDSGLTPHLVVAVGKHTRVPMEFVKDGQIVLNVSQGATRNLLIGNDLIRFSARFNGASRDIEVPIDAVVSIYARENAQGLSFAVEEVRGVQEWRMRRHRTVRHLRHRQMTNRPPHAANRSLKS